MTERRVAVVNLGCRVNRVESDRISSDLAAAGFAMAAEEDAELVVINTCAVTGEAEAKTRKAVRHALALPLEPWVVATGCAVNLNPEELEGISPRVVVEPAKARIVDAACRTLGAVPVSHASAGTRVSDGRVRLGVKIQDGCNHRCSYCIVWKARGPETSLSVEDVLCQVRGAVAAGAGEVVLTGVNLGAYRGDDGWGGTCEAAGLVREILGRTAVPQLRLSSIEPMDVDEDLILAMAEGGERVAPFLHLPIQSGCSATLRRMNRPYGADDLLALAEGIRAALPAIALSADVIVGFPGETDEEFGESLALCEAMGLSRMHVFRYSKRPGTPAATMPGQVPPEVMAERSVRMRALATRLARDDARRRVGSRERCVIEYPGRGTLGSFHRAVIEGAEHLTPGSVAKVGIMGVEDSGLVRCRLVEG